MVSSKLGKCPKCGRRKGKRWCPALEAGICTQCCGEHRLRTISCPSDCPHLESEYYQQERRFEKAASRGREFLLRMQSQYPARAARGYALALHALLYWYMRRYGPLDDAELAQALEDLERMRSPVAIAPAYVHRLARFLAPLLERGTLVRRYTAEEISRDDERRLLRRLAAFLRERADKGGTPLHEEVSRYFDELDFEADLNYSPEDDLEEEVGGPSAASGAGRGTPGGGLILPSGLDADLDDRVRE